MVNYLGLTVAGFASLVGAVASLVMVTYLWVVAAYRGFFRHYTIFYVYLFTTMMFTCIGALLLLFFHFDKNSQAYFILFYSSKAPLILFKYLVVCWLYWLVLARDYPSIRFSFVMIFLATVTVFLFYFALVRYPHPANVMEKIKLLNLLVERYFTVAQVLLLGMLGVLAVAFRLSVNRHLAGIALGLGSSFVLSFAYSLAKTAWPVPWVTNFHPVPYLSMLLILCFGLSRELRPAGQCITAHGLKSLDDRLFEFLAWTRLYNRFTDHLFFGFFDLQTAADFERWRYYQKLRRKRH